MTLSRQVIDTGNPALDPSRKSALPLSPAIRGGDFVFLSGMTAIDPATGERAHGAVAAETRRVLTNMGQVLEAAGSSLAKVVKVNVLIYSMLEYENMNSIYREFFPADPPARTGMRRQADRRPQGRDRLHRLLERLGMSRRPTNFTAA